VQQYLDNNTAPEQIILELSSGITEVGDRFRREDYFLSELIYSGEIFKMNMAKIQPLCKTHSDMKSKGVVVIGTVHGDIHDLGKNIVCLMLESAGFTVIDLGVDVPAGQFVEAVRDSKASLVGMSMLLTTVFDEARSIIDEISRADLRDKVKIMIGGSVANDMIKQQLGADFYGKDAIEAVDIAREVYQ
jgi:methanogenic corrinoid protein MtbC1